MKSKFWQVLIIIEINILLGLLVFLLFKANSLEKKVFRTNKFVYDMLMDKRIVELGQADNDDIIVGNADAPVTVVMYSKFDCGYCKVFFEVNYPQLTKKYIDKGIVKFVIRFLSLPSNQESFYIAKCSYYAHSKNVFTEFNNELIFQNSEKIDSIRASDLIFKIVKDSSGMRDYFLSSDVSRLLLIKREKAKEAGIFKTPTFIINGNLLLGNRNFPKFEEFILENLEACD